MTDRLRTRATAAEIGAGVPPGRFDLAGEARTLIRERSLRHPSALRSFGFDHVNGHIYTVQPTTDRPPDSGDLTVTKLGLGGERILGRMYLTGFGHGGQIGVEPAGHGSDPYLWTEYEARRDGEGEVRGARLCRFRFADGPAQVDWRDGADRRRVDLQDRTPRLTPEPVAPRPAIDPWYGRLAVRFDRGGDRRVVVYELRDARRGLLGPAHRVAERGGLPVHDPDVLPEQGFAVFGRHLYVLHGSSYGGTYVTCADLDSRRTVDRRQIRAFLDLVPFREPHGMAVYVEPERRRPWLCAGFVSGPEGARKASITCTGGMV